MTHAWILILQLVRIELVRVADLYEDGSFTLMPATGTETDGFCVYALSRSLALVRAGRRGLAVTGECP